MTTVKVIFRSSVSKRKEGSLYFRVIRNRKVVHLNTGCKIYGEEWDNNQGKIIFAENTPRRSILCAVEEKIEEKLSSLRQTILRLDNSGKEYDICELSSLFCETSSSLGFFTFGKMIVLEAIESGKNSRAAHYSSSLRSFLRFMDGEEVSFNEFNAQLLVKYERFLKESGLCSNTTSYYMRKLRAIYNTAVERGITNQSHPFRHVYTGIAKTRKRAVSLDVIKSLKELDLRDDHYATFARDMFLFSFYTRGMSIVDMAYLKKKDLQNGMLVYTRRKTNQQLVIKWEEPMQEIVWRNDVAQSEYLLPIIKPIGKDERRQYLNAAHLINEHLKNLGRLLGLPHPLTMYVARHAWASIAMSRNIPVSIISQGMGHESEKTTRIYLSTIDTSQLDNANCEIINLICK